MFTLSVYIFVLSVITFSPLCEPNSKVFNV